MRGDPDDKRSKPLRQKGQKNRRYREKIKDRESLNNMDT